MKKLISLLLLTNCGSLHQTAEKPAEQVLDASEVVDEQKQQIMLKVCELVVGGIEEVFDQVDAIEKAARGRIQNVFKNNLAAAEKSDCKK
jgi:hypothetical protein